LRTFVYVDGFNLYYRAVRGTPYKWLNIHALCRSLLPRDDIRGIKYFTAHVVPRPHDPDQLVRQQTFLRALRTLPNMEIILGQFLTHVVEMRAEGWTPANRVMARVIKTEEKGSDVNLASHLLVDGFKGRYELAVVVSNDTDLVEPIRLVRQELGLPVGILNPHKHPSHPLKQCATFTKRIRASHLRRSQFPNTLADASGTFHKPSSW
jgi:uncharacterized LabA/DUF88 family protein